MTWRISWPSIRSVRWHDLGDRVACLALIAAVALACVLGVLFLSGMPSPR